MKNELFQWCDNPCETIENVISVWVEEGVTVKKPFPRDETTCAEMNVWSGEELEITLKV